MANWRRLFSIFSLIFFFSFSFRLFSLCKLFCLCINKYILLFSKLGFSFFLYFCDVVYGLIFKWHQIICKYGQFIEETKFFRKKKKLKNSWTKAQNRLQRIVFYSVSIESFRRFCADWNDLWTFWVESSRIWFNSRLHRRQCKL